jgi:hypothetical protein
MAVSKVKSSKQAKRLLARRQAWEAIPTATKFSAKSGNRAIYTKPGSNKK